MMHAYRTAVTGIAMLVVGILPLQGFGEDGIGDPWWEVSASTPLPVEDDTPEVPGRPVNQAKERIVLKRRELAMNVLRGELAVVRRTCPNLAPEARRAILSAGIEVVDASVQAERLRLDNQISGTGPVGPPVVAAVGRAVEKAATEQEASAYRRELSARAERRRAAAVAVLVETVDRTAMLDDEQRERLASALNTKWQPFWDHGTTQAGHARMTANRLPPGVVAVVGEVLDPDEFSAWQEQLRRLPGS